MVWIVPSSRSSRSRPSGWATRSSSIITVWTWQTPAGGFMANVLRAVIDASFASMTARSSCKPNWTKNTDTLSTTESFYESSSFPVFPPHSPIIFPSICTVSWYSLYLAKCHPNFPYRSPQAKWPWASIHCWCSARIGQAPAYRCSQRRLSQSRLKQICNIELLVGVYEYDFKLKPDSDLSSTSSNSKVGWQNLKYYGNENIFTKRESLRPFVSESRKSESFFRGY